MMQRFGPSDSPLAPVGLPSSISAATATTEVAAASVLRLPSGDVAVDFRATATDDKHHSATYELLVSNDTPSPLATFAYAVEAPGNRKQMTWNAIVVPPYSAIAVEIDVAIPRRRRMPRVIAEVFSDEAQLTLDAPPPSDPRGGKRHFALIASACFVLALGAGAYAGTRPRVIALGAPDSVRGGVAFSVAYAMADASTGRYVVETPDGLQIRRGDLSSASGAFAVTLPKSATSNGYDVHVWANGRFGAGERTTHVLALPISPSVAVRHDRTPPLRLGSLALERDVVGGGESIVISYHATEDPGMVRLIDALGTVRAEALLNRRGRSIIVAPHVDADQDFRIVATVENGRGRDEVTTPVTILHSTAPAVAASGTATAPGAAVGESLASVGSAKSMSIAPIAVDRDQILGRDVVVRVDRFVKNLHVSLMGTSTDEIVGIDVRPGERTVLLSPPDTLAPARYAVVATYTSGLGQETLIRPITIRAR